MRAGDIPDWKDDGVEIRSGGLVLFRLRPTGTSVPNAEMIRGNFLIEGPHWTRLRENVAERRAALGSGIDESLRGLLRETFPELQPHLYSDAPEGTPPDLINLCVDASRSIRLHRSLALERPVNLHAAEARIRILPLRGSPAALIVPFEVEVERHRCPGAILLSGTTDPLCVALDRIAEPALAQVVWAIALLGFAAVSAPRESDPVAPRSGSPSTRSRGAVKPRRGRTVGDLRTRRAGFWSPQLRAFGPGAQYEAAFVAGHVRRLLNQQPSAEARERARALGVVLRDNETWVRPHSRGLPDHVELDFRWRVPPEGERLLQVLLQR